jgi:hypothetical protein
MKMQFMIYYEYTVAFKLHDAVEEETELKAVLKFPVKHFFQSIHPSYNHSFSCT